MKPSGIPVWRNRFLFAVAYLLSAQLGSLLTFKSSQFVTFWIPGGLYVSILILSKLRDWPWYMAGACMGNILFDLSQGRPMGLSLLFCTANTAEALTGACLVRHFLGERVHLSSFREVVFFALLSPLLSTTLGATLGSGAIKLYFHLPFSWFTWILWWVSDMIGILALAPFILIWSAPLRKSWTHSISGARILELIFLLGSIAACSILVFGQEGKTDFFLGRYIVFPLLILTAFRFGSRGVTSSGLVLSFSAVGSFVQYRGCGLSELELIQCVWSLQAFLGVTLFTALSFVAVLEEQKADQELLAGSERRYRLLFENAPLGVFHLNSEGVITDVNSRTTEILDVPRHKLVGLNLPERLRDVAMLESLQTCLSGKPSTFEGSYRSVLSDKQIFLRVWFAPLERDSAGEHSGGIGMIEDITRSKAAEEQILHLHRRNELILGSVGEGIVGLDEEGRVTFVNPKAKEELGYTETELIGKDLHQLVHHSRADATPYPATDCPMSKSLRAGVSSMVRDEVLWRKNGTSFAVSYSSTPILEEGSIKGAVVGFRDITALKSMQEAREKLEAQLRQSQRIESLGILAGGIAHDFNNILTAMIGYTELALDNVPPRSQEENNLRSVIKAGHRAKDLVKQILLFSRKGEQQIKPTLITPLIKEGIKLVRATLPSTVEIEHEIAVPPERVIMGDPTQIHQVIMNLCTNAAHAMKRGSGTLSIRLHDFDHDATTVSAQIPDLKPGGYVRLEVSDTGYGMSPEILSHIFDPFFTTKMPGEGTGMGLSVVHGIIANHGGAITVSSSLGKGSTFTVFLPKTSGLSTSMPDELPDLPRGTESILFVDDEEAIANLGKAILEKLGYRVVSTTSSLNALKTFQADKDQFDLVITDYTMPSMTGMDLARAILALRKDLPIILSTGYSQIISETEAKKGGIACMILKPIRRADLAMTVRRVLDEAVSGEK